MIEGVVVCAANEQLVLDGHAAAEQYVQLAESVCLHIVHGYLQMCSNLAVHRCFAWSATAAILHCRYMLLAESLCHPGVETFVACCPCIQESRPALLVHSRVQTRAWCMHLHVLLHLPGHWAGPGVSRMCARAPGTEGSRPRPGQQQKQRHAGAACSMHCWRASGCSATMPLLRGNALTTMRRLLPNPGAGRPARRLQGHSSRACHQARILLSSTVLPVTLRFAKCRGRPMVTWMVVIAMHQRSPGRDRKGARAQSHLVRLLGGLMQELQLGRTTQAQGG